MNACFTPFYEYDKSTSTIVSMKRLLNLLFHKLSNKTVQVINAEKGILSDYPFIREFSSPISQDQLKPLDKRCQTVQFSSPLTKRDLQILANFLMNYPDLELRIYGHHGINLPNLQFLSPFVRTQKLCIDVWDLSTFQGIEYIFPYLKSLTIGATKQNQSLQFLSGLPKLKELRIDGHSKKIETISQLKNLEKLTLRSVTLGNIEFLKDLRNLWWIAFKLGGCRNLTDLSSMKQIKYLELWMIRGMQDLEFIPEMSGLQFLFLQALKQVTNLPSLSNLLLLRRIQLETMKGLINIDEISATPMLEELLVLDTPQLKPEQFAILRTHPSIKRISIGLGSNKKNEEVYSLLPFERMKYSKEDFSFR